ncbi:MAG: hypothetical protein NZ990_07360 [Myxococcota bacterium]|nr:hypothetical protein [Myxococcota bacterium]
MTSRPCPDVENAAPALFERPLVQRHQPPFEREELAAPHRVRDAVTAENLDVDIFATLKVIEKSAAQGNMRVHRPARPQ